MRLDHRGGRTSARPAPALLAALIALVAALAGTASALPGKNTVDKNDIKKNAVKSKAIKNAQVKATDIGEGAVGTGEIANASVGAGDFAPQEQIHNVGAPGEPAFSNGGDGDCVWTNGASVVAPVNPIGYWKDDLGHVHVRGIASSADGPGGDGVCDPFAPGEGADGVVFTMPPGYQPENFELIGLGAGLIAPAAGATVQAIPVPGGAVFADGVTLLDGGEFRPAPGAVRSADPARIDARDLERLLR